MGTFIEISVDDARYSAELREKLVTACPVDIFAIQNARLTVRQEQEDECILCEACLLLAPAQTLTIRKTYSPECLVSRAGTPASIA